MKTILRILDMAGGYRRDLSLRIENPPYPLLVITALSSLGPCGLWTISVGHCDDRKGGLVCSPEMDFELSKPLLCPLRLVPFRYRNDRLGIVQVSRAVIGTNYAFHPHAFERQQHFTALWDKRLRSYGYLAAFERPPAR